MQNILWRCHNLPSAPHLQNSVIICGTKNIQHNSVEDSVYEIVDIAISLRCKYHAIAIFVCRLLCHDNNWSINRVYIDQINNYLCYKSKLNGVNFINHLEWTLQDGSPKPNLFFADILHLVEERNAKLAVLIYNSIIPNASKMNEIISIPMLPCNVSVCNPVCNPEKPVVKYVRKSIYKSVTTSSVRLGKPIMFGLLTEVT